MDYKSLLAQFVELARPTLLKGYRQSSVCYRMAAELTELGLPKEARFLSGSADRIHAGTAKLDLVITTWDEFFSEAA